MTTGEDKTQGPSWLLTSQQTELVILINHVFLSTVICVFGIVSNIINIVIFFKQGFEYTMNISLCGLSLSDLGVLVSQTWSNICYNPLLREANINFVPEDVQYLTGSAQAVSFGRINGWITVFITAERCLGIAVPLKVKQIITARRTATIIIVVYIVNMLAVATEYFGYYLDWMFYPEKNKTLYGAVLNKPEDGSGILPYVLNIFLGYGSFIAVIVLTIILVINLGKKSAWRKKATLESGAAVSKTNRDRKTMKMVVLIAVLMIACCIPFTIVVMAMMYEPELGLLRKYQNTFLAMMSVGLLFQNINSSVNIFLYYKMSTKYRQTFHQLFPACVIRNPDTG